MIPHQSDMMLHQGMHSASENSSNNRLVNSYLSFDWSTSFLSASVAAAAAAATSPLSSINSPNLSSYPLSPTTNFLSHSEPSHHHTHPFHHTHHHAVENEELSPGYECSPTSGKDNESVDDGGDTNNMILNPNSS